MGLEPWHSWVCIYPPLTVLLEYLAGSHSRLLFLLLCILDLFLIFLVSATSKLHDAWLSLEVIEINKVVFALVDLGPLLLLEWVYCLSR